MSADTDSSVIVWIPYAEAVYMLKHLPLRECPRTIATLADLYVKGVLPVDFESLASRHKSA